MPPGGFRRFFWFYLVRGMIVNGDSHPHIYDYSSHDIKIHEGSALGLEFADSSCTYLYKKILI